MNITIVEIFIPDGITRHIALYDGMDGNELKDLLLSCFYGCEVIGLQNSEGVVYPLSLILKNPYNFGNKKFQAVVRNNISGLIEDAKPEDVHRGMGFEKEVSKNPSPLKLKNSAANDSTYSTTDSILDAEFRKKAFSIAEVKAVLGLGQYSSEFLIDFFIGLIDDTGDDDDCDDSSWLINKQQFDTAMSQLVYRQYVSFSIDQQILSDYVVRSIFTLFDEDKSGYCDLRQLGCGLMLFSGGEIIDRAQMAYKLVAESHSEDGEENNDEGVNTESMTTAIASVLKVVAILNSSYLNSCDPLITAEEITKRAFARAKLLLCNGSTIAREDFEYWFSVVLTIYNEIEEEEEETVDERDERRNEYSNYLSIDTESAKYDADTDLENGDVRVTMAPNAVVLELQRAKYLLGLTGVAAEDLMELLGEVSSEGMLSEDTWQEYLSEFVVGDKNEKRQGVELGMKLFRAFDLYDEDVVSYIDFCAGLSILSDSPIEDKIMVAFVLNDTESIGMISVPELQNLILGSLRVVVSCSAMAAGKVEASGVSLEELSRLTVMEGLAVMELTHEDSLTLETVSEIALKCVALSAK